MSKRVLVVVADPALRRSLGEQLAAEGFAVAEAGGAAEGLGRAEAGFDVMLLDAGLPDGDGRLLCRRLRECGQTAPVILLTEPETGPEADDAGVDDVLAKPFRLGTLLARLRAQLRRHELRPAAAVAVGPYSFHPAAKILSDGRGRRIRLTEKEAAILAFLHRAGSRVVAREVLLHEVWGYNPEATTHTVETHVYRLRRKIEPDPARARILVTEPGGYRLVT